MARTVNVRRKRSAWRRVFRRAGGRSRSRARREYAFGQAMRMQNMGRLAGMRRTRSRRRRGGRRRRRR